MELGKITYEYGASPNDQEKSVADVLAKRGNNVHFLAAKRIPHYHTPDILIGGKYWEIKSLRGKSKSTLAHRLREATHQSKNIIIDIRQSKMRNDVAVRHILHYLTTAHTVKNVVIIDKNCNLTTAKGSIVL